MSNLTRNRSFIGKGTIYVKERNSTTEGLLTLGNCSELSLAVNEEKQEQQDYENAGGGILNSVSRISSITSTVTALSVSPYNLALAMRGLVNEHAGGPQVAEPHVAYDEGFIPLDHLLDSSQTITVTGEGQTPTYVPNVDYAVKNGGIKIVDGSSILDGSVIEVDYTSRTGFDIEGLTIAGLEYEVVFDGLNEADSGKPVLVTMYKVKFNPTQALSLISDDFGDLPMTFDIIKDDSISGTGESQYIKIQMAD